NMSTERAIPCFKCVLVGDGGTGKSVFMKRHLTGEFNCKYEATTGVDVCKLSFLTDRGQLDFNVWDTAGHEQHGSLRDGYYVQAQSAMIFFDVDSRPTYNNVHLWHQALIKVCGNIPIVVCGNKMDLKTMRTTKYSNELLRKLKVQVSLCDVDQRTNDNSYPITTRKYYPISTKSHYNIEKPFLWLARILVGDPRLSLVEEPALRPPEQTVYDRWLLMLEN
ncbi:hypothetical protein KR093_004873, partial [Drosophila rubida]